MGLLKQYRAKSTTFRDGKSAADFVSNESSFDKINNKNRRADDSKRASSTTSFSNNGGDDKKQQQVIFLLYMRHLVYLIFSIDGLLYVLQIHHQVKFFRVLVLV